MLAGLCARTRSPARKTNPAPRPDATRIPMPQAQPDESGRTCITRSRLPARCQKLRCQRTDVRCQTAQPCGSCRHRLASRVCSLLQRHSVADRRCQMSKGAPAHSDAHAGCRSLPLTSDSRMVGLGRFERPTSRLSGVRSNQLSYRPRSRTRRSEVRKGRRVSCVRHPMPDASTF